MIEFVCTSIQALDDTFGPNSPPKNKERLDCMSREGVRQVFPHRRPSIQLMYSITTFFTSPQRSIREHVRATWFLPLTTGKSLDTAPWLQGVSRALELF